METIKFQTQIDDDGLLKLELPTDMPNCKLEVLIVMQPLNDITPIAYSSSLLHRSGEPFIVSTLWWCDRSFLRVINHTLRDDTNIDYNKNGGLLAKNQDILHTPKLDMPAVTGYPRQ